MQVHMKGRDGVSRYLDGTGRKWTAGVIFSTGRDGNMYNGCNFLDGIGRECTTGQSLVTGRDGTISNGG